MVSSVRRFYFSNFNEFLAPLCLCSLSLSLCVFLLSVSDSRTLCTRLNYENANYSRDWFEWPRNEQLLNKQLLPWPSGLSGRSIFKTRYPRNGILKLPEYTLAQLPLCKHCIYFLLMK